MVPTNARRTKILFSSHWNARASHNPSPSSKALRENPSSTREHTINQINKHDRSHRLLKITATVTKCTTVHIYMHQNNDIQRNSTQQISKTPLAYIRALCQGSPKEVPPPATISAAPPLRYSEISDIWGQMRAFDVASFSKHMRFQLSSSPSSSSSLLRIYRDTCFWA